ncbi:MAG: hypothetical protein JSS51_09795 [Planctomycetes bacterium]|nr:hypothetical protein [Planctomycetota bacterium]
MNSLPRPGYLLALCAGCAVAHGAPQTFDWNAPSGGLWSVAANWNPIAVPTLDIDTANIGGTLPLAVDISGENASIGFLRINNPNAEVRVRTGRTLAIGQDLTLNGTLTIGEQHPSDLTIVRAGTLFNCNVTGAGSVLLRSAPGDATRTYVQSPGGRVTTWGSSTVIRGSGSLLGAHRILGRVVADVPGSAIEFRANTFDGFGSGRFIADGAVFRLFQAFVTDATLEAKNGGRIELASPASGGSDGSELIKRSTVRGSVRSIQNITRITDTDFDGTIDILPSTGIFFAGFTKPIKLAANVRSAPGAGNATIAFATGTPTGGGEIVLNAETVPEQAELRIDQMELGGAWNLRGQGLVSGSIKLVGAIVADRASGPPLAFERGTITGPGTLEARGATIEFRELNLLQNVQLLATQGGGFTVSESYPNYPAVWTGVTSDSSINVIGRAELAFDNCAINGSVVADFATLRFQGASTTINGEIELRNSVLYKSSSLYLSPTAPLLGSGEIRMQALSAESGSVIIGGGGTLPASRPVRGAGALAGPLTFLGKVTADGPANMPLTLRVNTFDGAGQGTIEVTDQGKLVILGLSSETTTLRNTRITALAGAPPVQIGANDKLFDDQDIWLTSVDVDADCVLSQRAINLQDCIFRRQCEFLGPGAVYIRGNSRFDGTMILKGSGSADTAYVSMEDPQVTIAEVVFQNPATGVTPGYFSGSRTGPIIATFRGTGVITARTPVGGKLAPSDYATGSPVGTLTFPNYALVLLADTTLEADVLSTNSYDRVEALTGVTVNGKLEVRAPADFYPPPTFNFHLIRGKATGAFTTVIGPPGFITTMTYNAAGALARFEKICPADLTGDGRVDDADFSLFCLGYDLLACADPAMPTNCPADLNRDREVDDADFRTFVLAYGRLLCD